MPKVAEGEFMDRKAVCRRTGLASWTLNDMVKARRFPRPKLQGRRNSKRWWSVADVERWIARTKLAAVDADDVNQ